MPVTNPREKFVHELRMGYDEEHRYLEVQRQIVGLVSDKELRSLLEQHTEETRGHIRNLEQIFSGMRHRQAFAPARGVYHATCGSGRQTARLSAGGTPGIQAGGWKLRHLSLFAPGVGNRQF